MSRGVLNQPFFTPRGRYFGAAAPTSSVVQRPWVQMPGMKPEGFWYSGGNDWWRWVLQDTPDWWKDYREVHEIEIDMSRVLLLRSETAVRAFHNRFAPRSGPYRGLPMIDWRAVEKEWAGVEIIPYQDGLRLDRGVGWYYPWDAASGCIWDLAAITGIRHVGTMPPLPARR